MVTTEPEIQAAPADSNSNSPIRIKGQLILEGNCQAMNSSKEQTKKFVFIMRRVFVLFLDKIEDTKKTFQNYLTFKVENGKLDRDESKSTSMIDLRFYDKGNLL